MNESVNSELTFGKVGKTLEFVIDNKAFYTEEQYQTGRELKKLAGIPPDTELFLQIKEPWQDELIDNDEKVNLARPDIEHFFVKKKLHFTINGERFVWYLQFITGAQLREAGKVEAEDDIYLKIDEPFDDELINDSAEIDLALPGRENFISKEKAITEIVVNGDPKNWTKNTISYEEVVQLAFGGSVDYETKVYTIVYKRGPKKNPQGSMVKGDIVKVKNRMIFNVTPTDKS